MKKMSIILGLVIVLALGVWYFAITASKEKPGNQNVFTVPSASSSEFTVQVPMTDVDKNKLPEKFPSDVPLETEAVITYNYNAINAAGEYQSSREFVSKKTPDENFALYQSALKSSGWTLSSAIDDTVRAQKIILASKGSNNLNIRIYTDAGQVKVSINNITK